MNLEISTTMQTEAEFCELAQRVVICRDCGVDTMARRGEVEDYMVCDDVWRDVGMVWDAHCLGRRSRGRVGRTCTFI